MPKLMMAYLLPLLVCGVAAAADALRPGRIAVFKDNVPIVGAASQPDYLAKVLGDAGFSVTMLTAADLADKAKLSPQAVDVVVLPYGASFPLAAAENFRAFLMAGGSFLSMGGYALDNLYGGETDSRFDNVLRCPSLEEDNAGMFWLPTTKPDPAKFGPDIRIVPGPARTGKRSLMIRVPQEAAVTWYETGQKVEKPAVGKGYTVSCYIKTEDVRDGHGAYLAVNYLDAEGKRISFQNEGFTLGNTDWRQAKFIARVPPKATHLTVVAVMHGHGTAWFDDFDLRIQRLPLNTSTGPTRDWLAVDPKQIGVFDPSYVLSGVRTLKPSPGQHLVSSVTYEGDFQGFGASGLVANNNVVGPVIHAKRTPLLHAYDKLGRFCGSAAALLENFEGPFKGSSWAYFGVTNADLFAPERPQARQALVNVVERLVRKTFVHDLTPSFYCYRHGETVALTAKVSNFGPSDAQAAVTFKVTTPNGSSTVHTERVGVTGQRGKTVEVTARWSPPKFESNLYRVVAELELDGKAADQMESGFVVWDEGVLKRGFPLSYRGNYFHAGEKPLFLVGTNQTGILFGSPYENPLRWDAEFQKMQDHGLNVLRILHYTAFLKPGAKWGAFPLMDVQEIPEPLARKLDAVVQLCQKHKVIVYFSLHEWCGLGNDTISREVFAAERRWNKLIAQRYRDVPGIVYDIENEVAARLTSSPDVNKRFREFLALRYRDDDGLRKAWGTPVSLATVEYDRNQTGWGNLRLRDSLFFERSLFEEWIRENVAGVRDTGAQQPVTAEYYLMPGWDPGPSGSKHMDFCNIHDYDYATAAHMKCFDRRAQGRSFSVGEFGARHHPAFIGGGFGAARPEPKVWAHFLKMAHLTFGVGGSMICNWDWKDLDEGIFPWGLNYPGDLVSKRVLNAYRNASLLFRRVRPKYVPPEVFLVLPETHLLGGGAQPPKAWYAGACEEVLSATMNAAQALIQCRVPFGVLNEYDLANIPSSAKLLFCPVPFCWADATYEKVKAFVQRGGTVYVSGDFSFDETRQRTRATRLRELAGAEFVAENYANIGWAAGRKTGIKPSGSSKCPAYEGYPALALRAAGGEVLAQTADSATVMVKNKVGSGSVFFLGDPVELHSADATSRLYAALLDDVGIQRLKLSPDLPSVQTFETPTVPGCAYVLYNSDQTASAEVRLGSKPEVTLSLGADATGFALLSERGELRAVEASSAVKLGGATVLQTNIHVMLVALDDADVRESKALLLMPIGEGWVELAGAEGKGVELGELRGTKWHVLESAKAEKRITIDASRNFGLLLLIAPDARQQAVAAMERLVNDE